MTQRPPWTDRYKTNWDDSFSRMMAWREGSGLDRPLMLTPVSKSGNTADDPEECLKSYDADDLDESFRLAHVRQFLESTLFLAESAPYAGTNFACKIGMLASTAGARVGYAKANKTAWIEARENLYDLDLPVFRENSPAYAFAIRMIHRHAETFGYDCILGADHLLDPLTTLAMMRGADRFCVDLIERPETVKRWRDRLADLYLAIAGGFRAARAAHGRREHMNWTRIWGPGDIEAQQCDLSAMLSPAMFNEFAMPVLERLADFYDFAMWHLDGPDEIRHLDSILSVRKIRAVQWVDLKGYGPVHYADLFRRIRAAGRSLTFTCPSIDSAVEVTRALGKDGLALRIQGLKSEKDVALALKRLAAV